MPAKLKSKANYSKNYRRAKAAFTARKEKALYAKSKKKKKY